ncbi:MAG TPA: hypothetical protein VFK02_11565 [Kofleriaceae bacterium]|nr:hypothetical protein [Kofleriaceae bacterium]
MYHVETWRAPQRLLLREWKVAKSRLRPPREAGPSPSLLLSRIYELCARGDTDGALDKILDTVDDLIASGDLTGCDKLLQQVDVDRLDIPCALGFLSATHVIRDRLPARPGFCDAVHTCIARDRPEDAERLVVRFR